LAQLEPKSLLDLILASPLHHCNTDLIAVFSFCTT